MAWASRAPIQRRLDKLPNAAGVIELCLRRGARQAGIKLIKPRVWQRRQRW
jgi:hypothetical protein